MSTFRKRIDSGSEPQSLKRRKLPPASKASHEATADLLTASTESMFHEYDVLWGRNSIVYKQNGNLYFRELIRTHRNAYQTATKRKQKGAIVRLILDSIHGKAGRFMKQRHDEDSEDSSLEGSETQRWVEVPFQDAYTKVGHALRSCKRSGTNSPIQGGKLEVSGQTAPKAEMTEFMAALAQGLSTTAPTFDDWTVVSRDDSESTTIMRLGTCNPSELFALGHHVSIPDEICLPQQAEATLSLLEDPIIGSSGGQLSDTAAAFAAQFFAPPSSEQSSKGHLVSDDEDWLWS